MAINKVYECDLCKIRANANCDAPEGWFQINGNDSYKWWNIRPLGFEGDMAGYEFHLHVCGQNCLFKILSQRIGK
jgi:hypothetical protein